MYSDFNYKRKETYALAPVSRTKIMNTKKLCVLLRNLLD